MEEECSLLIAADRFLASKALGYEAWLEVRRGGVTATQVAKAGSGPGGFEQAVSDYSADFIEQDNPYMQFGRVWETPISLFLKEHYGIMPNEWLIAHGEQSHHRATPDGLSIGHEQISEVKTTGKDWNPERLPIQYRRQVQWQLHVTGAESCVFAWMLREERDGMLLPGWFEPKVVVLQRDQEMIAELISTADELWERVNSV